MAKGIRDKVAIIGMGCSKFGERWNDNAEDLMLEAFIEAIQDAGVEKNLIEAAWLSTAIEEQHVGKSGIPLAMALRLPYIPVTRVENYCASGSEAFRGAVYAVASGAADMALALGVEKLKDSGYGGLPQRSRGALNDQYWANVSAPGAFAQLAGAYQAKHAIPAHDLKRAMAQISVKSHENGFKNPKAHLRSIIDEDRVLNAPIVAEPLGLFDCCGVSDGAACAIVTTPEIAHSLGKDNLVTVKALQLSVSNGSEAQIKIGNCLPLRNIPVGSTIHCIEMMPQKGAQLARSAGASVQLLAKEGQYAQLRLRSGEVRKVHVDCRATLGEVGNGEHNLRQLGKAGAKRWRGIRPTVRGVVMNPVDHPHGGGEGKTAASGGPVSPWGTPTKGFKTRRNKRTSSMILVDRRKRKG